MKVPSKLADLGVLLGHLLSQNRVPKLSDPFKLLKKKRQISAVKTFPGKVGNNAKQEGQGVACNSIAKSILNNY